MLARPIGPLPWDGNGPRIHPFQLIQTLAVAPEEDAVNDIGGLVGAEGLGQHGADILVRIHAERRLIADGGDEALHHIVDHVGGDVAQLRHGGANLLHLFRPHVFQDHRGAVVADAQQEQGGLLRMIQCVIVSH